MAKNAIQKNRTPAAICIPFWAVLLLLLPVSSHAAFGFKLDGSLDKEAISYSYFEGDFRRILPPLEAFRSRHTQKTRDDSIFVFKYLSVIYAADSTTRPKAESYMVQLLKLMPTIELVDMYISDSIESIFKGVQGKFLSQQKYVREHDDLGRARPSSDTLKAKPEPHIAKEKSNGNSWVWWTVTGAGVAAAVGATIYLYEPKNETKKTVIPVWQGGSPQ
ncbi:MAG: hypothetical protein ABI036_11170 [Fibrobacteria bacterium]